MARVSIMVVDDHVPTREEIVLLMSAAGDLAVVAHASTGEEAVQKARDLRPDIVVMDILMPGMNGIEATQAILAENPAARVLALTNHTGRSIVRAVRDAGGKGYVRKDRAYEELVPAIRAVAAGQQYFASLTAECGNEGGKSCP